MLSTLRINDSTDIAAWNLNFCWANRLMYLGDVSAGSASSRCVARTKRSAAREVPGRDFSRPPALIGTLRRECLDQVVIFSEMHLRRIPSAYAAHYNQARTHLELQKDATLHRAVQRSGAIVAIPLLAELHLQYVRI